MHNNLSFNNEDDFGLYAVCSYLKTVSLFKWYTVFRRGENFFYTTIHVSHHEPFL
jgi:hypothetical protein